MDDTAALGHTLSQLIPPLDFYLDAANELQDLAGVIERSDLKADGIEDRFAREAGRLFPARPTEHHLPAAKVVHKMIHKRMDVARDHEGAVPEEYATQWVDQLRAEITVITGDPDDYWRYSEVWSRVAGSKWGSEVLQSSLLMTAIADFEVFISGFVQALLVLRPEILRGGDRKFSYRELESFKSIEEAQKHCAQDLVDGLLRGGYEDWTAWLRKQGLVVDGVTENPSARIIEAFQRRHIFVHNGGRVNDFYLAKVPSSKASVGDRMWVSERYIHRVVDALCSAALTLTFSLCFKLHKAPEEREHIDHQLNNYTYGLLLGGRDRVVASLAKWAEPHWYSDGPRLIGKVNGWVALKRIHGVKSIAKDVRSWDTGPLATEFRLVKLALLDEVAEGYSLARRMMASGDLSIEEWQTWPALESLRLYEAGLSSDIERLDPSGGFAVGHGTTSRPPADAESGPDISGAESEAH